MQDIIKLYIYDGYDKNIITFLNVICGIFKKKKRKLYLLKSGHTSIYHGDFKLLKYFIYSMLCILFQCKKLQIFCICTIQMVLNSCSCKYNNWLYIIYI